MVTLLRPDDLLVLQVRLVNLHLDTSQPDRPRLARTRPRRRALLVVQFPPQTIIERAFYRTARAEPAPPAPPPVPPPPGIPNPPPSPSASDPLQPPGSVEVRMGGPSRVVLQLPDDLHEIPYTLEGLLDWSRLITVLPPAAHVVPGRSNPDGQPAPAITEPGDDETALELPYRLVVAPSVTAHGRPAWVHSRSLVEHQGRVELWHTRLGLQSTRGGAGAPVEAGPTSAVPVRAVWSPDFVADGPLPSHTTDDTPFRAAMSPRDRDQIVILSAGYAGYTLTGPDGMPTTYVPRPAQAQRLFLSSLGGWLTSRGSWPYPVSYHYVPTVLAPGITTPSGAAAELKLPVAALDLVEWDHVATQGRDHYVRIVYEGFLFPFGHRASLIKVTERMVHAPNGTLGNPTDSPVAYLRQRMYIVVREPEKTYDVGTFAHRGLEMPLRQKIRIRTHVTPEIDPPAFVGTASFLVTVNGGAPFPFSVVGTDLAGHDVDFLAPLTFVSIAETDLLAVVTDYVSDDARRRCAVRGRNLAYADPAAGDTTLKTTSLYFGAEITSAGPPYTQAPFLPSLDSAAVTVPALRVLIGSDTPVQIAYYGPYLAEGLDPHAGVFAQIVGTPPRVVFSADKSGGLARPNLALTALSARKGLVSGDPGDAASGVIDPSAYFGDPDAKLFGTIDLGQLIPLPSGQNVADASSNAPEIRTQAIPNRRHPAVLRSTINWEPQLQDFTPAGSPVSIVFNQDGQKSALRLHVRLEQHLDGSPPVSQAHGLISAFQLRLFGVIALKIDRLAFDSSNGAKSTVAMQLAAHQPIGFEGPLSFIQTLADLLPAGLFGGSGPSITPTPTALRLSYTLGLPPVTCGVFSLEHIAIMAGLDLPYLDGKPAVEFAFASRARPFLVTVEIFGGGGFVHVVLDADGVRMVEGAIEFGGNFSLDVGVASGGVHVMAGVYFQLKGSFTDLTGFVDIGGEVSVLGIVSISIDLNLSLSWQHSPSGNVIQGRATLTVSVHVLFFSASVQLSVERSFSAGGGDPKVAQLMTASDWHEYARSFA